MVGAHDVRRRARTAGLATLMMLACLGGIVAAEPATRETKIERLERRMRQMNLELQQLKEAREQDRRDAEERIATIRAIQADVAEIEESDWFNPDYWANRFTLGGYGEMHANFGENGASDKFDLHRLVAYVGYDFADWIKLHSEFELEHAFVSDGNGDFLVEQIYVDFLLRPEVNIRVGRILTPLGIINKTHEPTTFNGVERPSFAKFIIPTTWSSDGAGVYGRLGRHTQYELYVVGGLDGSMFDAEDGIRGGRIKERPSLHEPAVTGRMDFFPLAGRDVDLDQQLRLGVSGYFGGLDNGNKGNNPGIDGSIHIYSADFEYSISRFDFRGAAAYAEIDGAREIGNGTAEGIWGWYAEAAYHFMPDSWKRGKLDNSDAVVFVRYDRYDTQHNMPSGVEADEAFDRDEWTIGVSFFPVEDLVVKADYQIRNSGGGEPPENLMNFGVGWVFQ